VDEGGFGANPEELKKQQTSLLRGTRFET